jgi:hypothetical protein
MSDLVKQVREHLGAGHKRGCEGDYAKCECGWSERTDYLLALVLARLEYVEQVCADMCEKKQS